MYLTSNMGLFNLQSDPGNSREFKTRVNLKGFAQGAKVLR
jgi:hypothetical protein